MAHGEEHERLVGGMGVHPERFEKLVHDHGVLVDLVEEMGGVVKGLVERVKKLEVKKG